MKPNYIAAFVAAVAYWLLGALWYGVLFNRAWTDLEHVTPQQASTPAVAPFIITFILNLVIAFFLAQLCAWRNVNTAARGAALGILIWIGFVGPVTYTTYMYEMRSKQLYAINEFFALVGFCLMGAILGAWSKKNPA
jgi:surface polysaccharide O-acyltransferase-like enzyme